MIKGHQRLHQIFHHLDGRYPPQSQPLSFLILFVAAFSSWLSRSSTAIDDENHWKVDDLVHLGIAEASRNAEVRRLILELRQRTRMFGLQRIPDRFERGRDEHLSILQAIADRAPDEAARLMAHHIDQARDAIIATIRREPIA